MRTVLKVFAVLIVLFLVAVGGFYLWWKTNSDRLLSEAEASVAEGEAFGQTTDNAGCLTAALRRGEGCGGFFCEVNASVFLRACLEASQPTRGFCDGVPQETLSGVAESVRWLASVCEAESYPADGACGRMLARVQEFCHPTDP